LAAVLQRVASASVTVDKQLISSIGLGILVFAAVGREDTEADADSLAEKILKVKLWPDENNGPVCLFAVGPGGILSDLAQWKQSVRDIQGEVLCGGWHHWLCSRLPC
jgi:D-aminoacyl-tRNA deacylase